MRRLLIIAMFTLAMPAQAQMTDELRKAAATCRQHVHQYERKLAGVPMPPGLFDKGWEHCEKINKKFNAEFLAEQSQAATVTEQRDLEATKAFADKIKPGSQP